MLAVFLGNLYLGLPGGAPVRGRLRLRHLLINNLRDNFKLNFSNLRTTAAFALKLSPSLRLLLTTFTCKVDQARQIDLKHLCWRHAH